jgi:hypothetical protein
MMRALYRPSDVQAALQDAADVLYPFLYAVDEISQETLWLTGGALRDCILGRSIFRARDIDLIFFNDRQLSKAYEKEIESLLREQTGLNSISVKNQARIGYAVDGRRYLNLFHSVTAFPDITVAIAAKINNRSQGQIFFYIPYGLRVFNERIIRPTPEFFARHSISDYYSWLARKDYDSRLTGWQITTLTCEFCDTPLFISKPRLAGSKSSADKLLPEYKGHPR